jgi:hypothetical protein
VVSRERQVWDRNRTRLITPDGPAEVQRYHLAPSRASDDDQASCHPGCRAVEIIAAPLRVQTIGYERYPIG